MRVLVLNRGQNAKTPGKGRIIICKIYIANFGNDTPLQRKSNRSTSFIGVTLGV